MDTLKLQSLATDLVNFANVPNPYVSSEDASTEPDDDQSDPEVLENVYISQDSNSNNSFISLPLGQGSPIIQNRLVSSPSPPTARRSSTTDVLLDLSCDVLPPIPPAPLLTTLSPRRPPVISCPTGTCDEQSIANNLPLVEDDVFLDPFDDGIDQVFIDHPSPAVNPENYPIMFRLIETDLSLEASPVIQQEEEAVPVPPPPDIDQDRPRRSLHRVDYRSLHMYGREGENAWLPQLQTWQEGDEKYPQEEREDRDDRGAPE